MTATIPARRDREEGHAAGQRHAVVAFPDTSEDVQVIVRICARHGCPVTPKLGWSDLAWAEIGWKSPADDFAGGAQMLKSHDV